MIVDTHVHVWSQDAARYPWQPTLAHVPIPTYPAPVEGLLADMDGAGVSHAVLVQPSVYGWDNRYLRDCLERWPDRFVGVCLVDPDSADPRGDLGRWCGERGCQGVRLNIIRQADPGWLAAPRQDAFWRAVEELGLSVSMHMDLGHAPLVARLAARHPSTTFMIDYLGAAVHCEPEPGGHLDRLAAQPNIVFKLLATGEDSRQPYPFADLVPFYRAVWQRFGARRMVFGSDYPGVRFACSYAQAVDWPRHLDFLSEADRRQILGATPAGLWRFA
jgi:predicted TIM-barrel fold metal-dependent hydrolase